MSDRGVKEMSTGVKLYNYLENNPEDFDITFLVGPARKEVNALKIFLKAASPALKNLFSGEWKHGKLGVREGISLPNWDASVFKNFIKLVISDTWLIEDLYALNLQDNDLFSLTAICSGFEMDRATKTLNIMLKDIILDFDSYTKSTAFLRLEQPHLKMILTRDDLNMKELFIFFAVHQWAKFRLYQTGLEETTENIRQVLGDCLFELRFPIMSFRSFSIVCLENVLTSDEKLAVYSYIGLQDSTLYPAAPFPFKTNRRNGLSILSLTNHCEVVENPISMMGPKFTWCWLKTNRQISLHGLGFLGPFQSNSYFNIDVKIIRRTDIFSGSTSMVANLKRKVYARIGKVLRLVFEQPIVVEPEASDDWNSYYSIAIILDGPATQAVPRVEGDTHSFLQAGTQFSMQFKTGQNPLAEIFFTKF